MRISDWSSDVCSSDLTLANHAPRIAALPPSAASVFHSSGPRICLSPVPLILGTARIAVRQLSANIHASLPPAAARRRAEPDRPGALRSSPVTNTHMPPAVAPAAWQSAAAVDEA